MKRCLISVFCFCAGTGVQASTLDFKQPSLPEPIFVLTEFHDKISAPSVWHFFADAPQDSLSEQDLQDIRATLPVDFRFQIDDVEE